jgi:hypothetical protein
MDLDGKSGSRLLGGGPALGKIAEGYLVYQAESGSRHHDRKQLGR